MQRRQASSTLHCCSAAAGNVLRTSEGLKIPESTTSEKQETFSASVATTQAQTTAPGVPETISAPTNTTHGKTSVAAQCRRSKQQRKHHHRNKLEFHLCQDRQKCAASRDGRSRSAISKHWHTTLVELSVLNTVARNNNTQAAENCALSTT